MVYLLYNTMFEIGSDKHFYGIVTVHLTFHMGTSLIHTKRESSTLWTAHPWLQSKDLI